MKPRARRRWDGRLERDPRFGQLLSALIMVTFFVRDLAEGAFLFHEIMERWPAALSGDLLP